MDHPRVGGEKQTSPPETGRPLGSPPRGRGKALHDIECACSAGITPAWAGKRQNDQDDCSFYKDHPRVGGEKKFCRLESCPDRGSPPRGRGKEITFPRTLSQKGITPAWAGKSFALQRESALRRDHPRVGGEKCVWLPGFVSLMGSPPRGRGKASHSGKRWCCYGITPAWAGKSLPGVRRIPAARDHPRVGGEKSLASMLWAVWLGSPPRGRGKVYAFAELFFAPQDHPRVGGEKLPVLLAAVPSVGSPPRGRGKGLSMSWHCRPPRITPAWAGKRLKRSHRSGIFISGPIPFHSVLHRPAGSGDSRAGRDGSPAGQPQNAGPA